MSIRAYKIIKKEVADTPAFNTGNDDIFMDWLESQNVNIELSENGGTIDIPVKLLREAIKKQKELSLDDFNVNQMKKDIKGLVESDWVEYDCY